MPRGAAQQEPPAPSDHQRRSKTLGRPSQVQARGQPGIKKRPPSSSSSQAAPAPSGTLDPLGRTANAGRTRIRPVLEPAHPRVTARDRHRRRDDRPARGDPAGGRSPMSACTAPPSRRVPHTLRRGRRSGGGCRARASAARKTPGGQAPGPVSALTVTTRPDSGQPAGTRPGKIAAGFRPGKVNVCLTLTQEGMRIKPAPSLPSPPGSCSSPGCEVDMEAAALAYHRRGHLRRAPRPGAKMPMRQVEAVPGRAAARVQPDRFVLGHRLEDAGIAMVLGPGSGLLVVDVDGPEAIAPWSSGWAAAPRPPRSCRAAEGRPVSLYFGTLRSRPRPVHALARADWSSGATGDRRRGRPRCTSGASDTGGSRAGRSTTSP